MPTQALVTSRMIQVMRAVSALRVSEQHCRVQHLSSALLTVHAPITITPKMVVRTHVLVTSLADTISRVATVVLSRVATVVLSRVVMVVLSRVVMVVLSRVATVVLSRVAMVVRCRVATVVRCRVATVVPSRVATVVRCRVATVVLSRDSVSIPQATIQMLSIA